MSEIKIFRCRETHQPKGSEIEVEAYNAGEAAEVFIEEHAGDGEGLHEVVISYRTESTKKRIPKDHTELFLVECTISVEFKATRQLIKGGKP